MNFQSDEMLMTSKIGVFKKRLMIRHEFLIQPFLLLGIKFNTK